MFTYNRVQILTRLTRDPEIRVISTGGKVAKLGCVVDGPRKKVGDNQWENEPVWLDVEVWNRGENGKMATLCEERLSKGSEVFIDGRLKMDSWTDREGQKRNKLLIVADEIRFLSSTDEAQPPAVEVQRSESGELFKEEIPF